MKGKSKKKKGERDYFVATLVILIVSLSIGYALFTEAINISGTAQTTGTFDVEFFDVSVVETKTTTSTIIAPDKNLLTIAVDLEEPTSRSVISVTVKNVATMKAELLSVDVTGADDADIVVTYPTWDLVTILDPEGTYQFDIIVEWAEESFKDEHDIQFTVQLNYQQKPS